MSPPIPDAAEALFHEGTRLMTAGAAALAEACFRQALALQPDFPEALANLGWLQEQSGQMDAAEASYRQAAALDPADVQIELNLAALLVDGKRFEAAEAVYQHALRRFPWSPAAWSNYGVLLACLKRETEAESCYHTALELDDSYARARFNLAYILLRQGRFAEGWRCLEAREWYAGLATSFSCPRWQGEALAGKSLIIGFECGHGDMIQFCRYAEVLKGMGAVRLGLICHPGLTELFHSLPDVDVVYSLADTVPVEGWDFWSPPLSLPCYCQTGGHSIPARIPYLAVDSQRLARWRPQLPASGPRVGLVWKGNPNFENDADRSLPSLAVLAPLGTVAGVSFISLQKGQGEEEARQPPAGLPMLALGEALNDFADTAAVISELDLLICVDTAVAHLAGALGQPCWLLLPDYRTDWRWLTARSDSPWYPKGMRLFRQRPGGDWAEVVDDVVAALRLWKNAREGSAREGKGRG
jgi:Flp pilus assembly protein TadD